MSSIFCVYLLINYYHHHHQLSLLHGSLAGSQRSAGSHGPSTLLY